MRRDQEIHELRRQRVYRLQRGDAVRPRRGLIVLSIVAILLPSLVLSFNQYKSWSICGYGRGNGIDSQFVTIYETYHVVFWQQPIEIPDADLFTILLLTRRKSRGLVGSWKRCQLAHLCITVVNQLSTHSYTPISYSTVLVFCHCKLSLHQGGENVVDAVQHLCIPVIYR